MKNVNSYVIHVTRGEGSTAISLLVDIQNDSLAVEQRALCEVNPTQRANDVKNLRDVVFRRGWVEVSDPDAVGDTAGPVGEWYVAHCRNLRVGGGGDSVGVVWVV